jgi:nucleotide-binding universal stress UspA family protein
MKRQRITVGYDGSPSARAALVWATAEASADGSALEVVIACPAGPATPWSLPNSEWSSFVRHRAEDLARDAKEIVDSRADVSTEVYVGLPGRVLAAFSAHSDLLVVGSAGHIGLAGWIRGSVSRYLLHHSECPLVVVGPESHAGPVRRLLVSSTLDLNGETFDAIGRWVRSRRLPVHVIASFALPTLMPDLALTFDASTVGAAVAVENAAYVHRLKATLPPGAEVTTEVVEALPIEALDRRAKTGDLLVVPRGWEHDVPFAHGTAPVCVV